MQKYATAARLGHDPTVQDIARIHNGGLNGYKMDATVHYWESVKARLAETPCAQSVKDGT